MILKPNKFQIGTVHFDNAQKRMDVLQFMTTPFHVYVLFNYLYKYLQYPYSFIIFDRTSSSPVLSYFEE